MITPKQFMEYWVNEGIAVYDAPLVYLKGNELITYTETQINANAVDQPINRSRKSTPSS